MSGLKICQWEPYDSNEFRIPLKYFRSFDGFAYDNADWADLMPHALLRCDELDPIWCNSRTVVYSTLSLPCLREGRLTIYLRVF